MCECYKSGPEYCDLHNSENILNGDGLDCKVEMFSLEQKYLDGGMYQ